MDPKIDIQSSIWIIVGTFAGMMPSIPVLFSELAVFAASGLFGQKGQTARA